MSESEPVIAIDGPAAVGKTTVGRLLAERMGCLFVDTGVMYRAVTSAAIEEGRDLADEQAITGLAMSIGIRIVDDAVTGDQRVIVDDQDVTEKIRSQAVDRNVSVVSSYSGVREAMVAQQREMASERGVVMVGRDIGTMVLPDARLKIYLTASLYARAKRRQTEMEARDSDTAFEATMADMERRDRIDSGREHSPMKPAQDAIPVDTSNLTADQVVKRIVELWRTVN